MFEILNRVSEGEMIEAVYEAGLRMTQRDRAEGRKQHGRPLTENPIAAQILDDVQRDAGKHVADLSDAELDHYIPRLSAMMFGRLRAGRPGDPERAEATLQEMRATYRPPYHAVR
jgi:hypothetical protein